MGLDFDFHSFLLFGLDVAGWVARLLTFYTQVGQINSRPINLLGVSNLDFNCESRIMKSHS